MKKGIEIRISIHSIKIRFSLTGCRLNPLDEDKIIYETQRKKCYPFCTGNTEKKKQYLCHILGIYSFLISLRLSSQKKSWLRPFNIAKKKEKRCRIRRKHKSSKEQRRKYCRGFSRRWGYDRERLQSRCGVRGKYPLTPFEKPPYS